MNTTIEQLQLSELKVLLRDQAEDTFPDLKDEYRLNMLAEKWHKFAEFCTCRDENNQLVGMIAFYDNQPATNVAYIPHVYVSKDYRGQGIFTELRKMVVDYVKEKGFKHIRLEVRKNNIIAQKAYLNNGFYIENDENESSIYMKYNI